MICIIAAVSSNGVIGSNGKIPWDFKEDKKWFREVTCKRTSDRQNVVVFGRKTFEEFGSKEKVGLVNILNIQVIIDGKYHIYRNRFCAPGSQQLNYLHDLEKLGYLTRENLPMWFFKVTEKGFELLTDITGLKEIGEDHMVLIVELEEDIEKVGAIVDDIVDNKTTDDLEEDVKSDIILSCAKNKTVVYVVPQFYEISLYKSRIINLNDLMVMLVDRMGLTFEQRLFKRIIDIVCSFIFLIIASPSS